MSMSRSKARKVSMRVLYQISLFKKNDIDYDKEEIIKDIGEDDEYVLTIVNGVLDKNDELEKIANKYLNNWNINRLGLTDQAIIKIAIYELLYTDTPKKVCIDEAIKLGKDYSDDAVVKMINGVLDKVYHSIG